MEGWERAVHYKDSLFAEAVSFNIYTVVGIATLKYCTAVLKALKNIYSTNYIYSANINALGLLITQKAIAYTTKKA